MKLTEFSVIDEQQRQAHCYLWTLDNEQPKCIVQLSHGMAEHVMRYEAFAEFLCKNGYAFCGSDHPGHGLTLDKEELGYFGDSGYIGAIERLHCVTEALKNMYPSVPVVLLGHSMGSFLARAYIARYGKEISAAIIMGTSGPNPLLGIGKALMNLLTLFKGNRGKSKFINNLMFGSYNKKFEGKSEYLWLTKDESIVKKYEDDDYCGFPFTLNGYKALAGVLGEVSKPEWAAKVPKDLPILIVSGSEDPVGNFGKGVAQVERMLVEAGVKHVNMILFEGDRHEILNEFDKENVYKVIDNFIVNEAL